MSDAFSMPRVAVAVRAGDEVLGSIWAAVPGPLSEERTEALCDAAKLVALHLLRVRAGADVQRRLRADLLSSALEGGAGAREALERLGLRRPAAGGLRGRAVGRRRRSAADGAALGPRAAAAQPTRSRCTSAPSHPRSAAALVGGVAYGLVPVDRHRRGRRGARRPHRQRLPRPDRRPARGRGRHRPGRHDVAGLADARAATDRSCGCCAAAAASERVARLADIQVEALMLELRDLAAPAGRPADRRARRG